MSTYTTGEIAKRCEVTVRTVQFYDAKGLLTPSALSEGGRRLYQDNDVQTLRRICLLKYLGLSLDSIKGVLESENCSEILRLLLDTQRERLLTELKERERQLKALDAAREMVRRGDDLSAQTLSDIENMMTDQKKLRKMHRNVLLLAAPAGAIEWGTIIYWIATGRWWPFVAGIPIVAALCFAASKLYLQHTDFICPTCGRQFHPSWRASFFARHTPKTRKLQCPCCASKDWCVETYHVSV